MRYFGTKVLYLLTLLVNFYPLYLHTQVNCKYIIN